MATAQFFYLRGYLRTFALTMKDLKKCNLWKVVTRSEKIQKVLLIHTLETILNLRQKNILNNRTITTSKHHTLKWKVLNWKLIATWSIRVYLINDNLTPYWWAQQTCSIILMKFCAVIVSKLKDEIIDPTIWDKFSFVICC